MCISLIFMWCILCFYVAKLVFTSKCKLLFSAVSLYYYYLFFYFTRNYLLTLLSYLVTIHFPFLQSPCIMCTHVQESQVVRIPSSISFSSLIYIYSTCFRTAESGLAAKYRESRGLRCSASRGTDAHRDVIVSAAVR